jgi:hypothetical protein
MDFVTPEDGAAGVDVEGSAAVAAPDSNTIRTIAFSRPHDMVSTPLELNRGTGS